MLSNVSFASVAPDVRISDNSGNVLNINSDGTLPVSGAGGAGGVLDITTVFADGILTGQTNTGSLQQIMTFNGYQYVGLWDANKNLALCRRATDAVSWSCVRYDGIPLQPTFTGSGLNDLSSNGQNTTTTTASTYDVEIDATGTPDTFKWRKDGGAYTTGVSCAITQTVLSTGVGVTFGATTGHTVGDHWTFTVTQKITINADNHQGISIGRDSDGYLHFNLGSYVTESGLKYRRSTSPDSISGLTAQQTISATYDGQASYPTFVQGRNGELLIYYRSNGASGNADHFLFKYSTASTTWSAAPGAQQSSVIGRFINGTTDTQSVYISSPYVDSNNFAHFAWTWRVAQNIDDGISYMKYDITNGVFKKADGTTITAPARYSTADIVKTQVGTGVDQGLEPMAYRHSVDIDSSGYPNIVYSYNSGSQATFAFSGSGLNDMTVDRSGVVTRYQEQPTYEIVIDGTSTPNTFKYRINGGAYTTLQKITGGPQKLNGGLKVVFAASTGHTLNDKWTVKPSTGHNHLYLAKWNGSSWSSGTQLVNLSETTNTGSASVGLGNGMDHKASIFHEGSTQYIVYASYTDGNGINVLSSNNGFSTVNHLVIHQASLTQWNSQATLAFDESAWEATHNFYFLMTSHLGSNSQAATFGDVHVFKWDASSGAGFKPGMNIGNVTNGDYHYGSVAGVSRMYGTYKQENQNIWIFDPNSDWNDLPYVITNLITAGDTLVFPSASTTLKAPLVINKAMRLTGVGELGSCASTLTSSTAFDMIQPTVSNVVIDNLCITNTGNGTARGINAVSAVSTPLTGIDVRNVKITLSGTGAKIGLLRNAASGRSDNVTYSVTSSDSTAFAEEISAPSSLGSGQSITSYVYNPKCNTSGGGGNGSRCFVVEDNNGTAADKIPTMYVYGGWGTSVEGAATTSAAASTFTGTDAVINLYGTVLSATDNDVNNAAGGTFNVSNVTLVNATATGTITGIGQVRGASALFTDLYSGDGTQGATTTCTIAGLTSITVKDGLITACA